MYHDPDVKVEVLERPPVKPVWIVMITLLSLYSVILLLTR